MLDWHIVGKELLFTPVSITPLIDTEDACFGLNASRPIAKGDLKWRDALLVAHCVNSNKKSPWYATYRISMDSFSIHTSPHSTVSFFHFLC